MSERDELRERLVRACWFGGHAECPMCTGDGVLHELDYR